MTTFRVPQREYQATDGACMTCGSLPREPCRAVKAGVRAAILPRVHRGRPGERFIIGRRQKPGRRRASGRAAGRLGARSYAVPPAGPVTVTAADGSVRVELPARPQRSTATTEARQPRQRRQRDKQPPAEAPPLKGTIRAASQDRVADRKPKPGKASGSATQSKRTLRIDNGTTTWSATAAGPSIHDAIKNQKRAAHRAPEPGQLRRPCKACLARAGELCRNPDGSTRAKYHGRR